MKTSPCNARRALTLIEVLVVIGVLVILAILLMPPALVGNKASPTRIQCVNNLKQVGIAFRIWQADHGDKYPMSVSETNAGTMELIESGTVWRHFQVMSNELNTPKILICPADKERQKHLASYWTGFSPTEKGQLPFAGDLNTSYFIGVEAADTSPQMFLAGDRNITTSLQVKSGLLNLTTNQPAGWTDKIHVKQGNVLLADASVQQFSNSALRSALENTGVITNRLALP